MPRDQYLGSSALQGQNLQLQGNVEDAIVKATKVRHVHRTLEQELSQRWKGKVPKLVLTYVRTTSQPPGSGRRNSSWISLLGDLVHPLVTAPACYCDHLSIKWFSKRFCNRGDAAYFVKAVIFMGSS